MGSAMNARPLAASLIALALSACATDSTRYPSLAQREAERVQGTFEPDTAAPAVTPAPPPSADLIARLGQLRDQAASAHREFLSAVPGAERLAKAAGDVASDSWASAQVALADLDSSRSNAAIALGDLDILFIDATLVADQREAIGAAREDVLRIVGEEDAVLARLRGLL
jgi:hypothetical protein